MGGNYMNKKVKFIVVIFATMLFLVGCTSKSFSPQDTSNETIQSIETYDDYLIMYEMILQDYFDNYVDAIKDTALYSEEGYSRMKEQYTESFQQQRDMYGESGKNKIIGKDTIVDFLITYRDSLKELTDGLKESLNKN